MHKYRQKLPSNSEHSTPSYADYRLDYKANDTFGPYSPSESRIQDAKNNSEENILIGIKNMLSANERCNSIVPVSPNHSNYLYSRCYKIVDQFCPDSCLTRQEAFFCEVFDETAFFNDLRKLLVCVNDSNKATKFLSDEIDIYAFYVLIQLADHETLGKFLCLVDRNKLNKKIEDSHACRDFRLHPLYRILRNAPNTEACFVKIIFPILFNINPFLINGEPIKDKLNFLPQQSQRFAKWIIDPISSMQNDSDLFLKFLNGFFAANDIVKLADNELKDWNNLFEKAFSCIALNSVNEKITKGDLNLNNLLNQCYRIKDLITTEFGKRNSEKRQHTFGFATEQAMPLTSAEGVELNTRVIKYDAKS